MSYLQRLWAVWRIEYIEMASKRKPECIFCKLPSESDEKALILMRSERTFVLMNRYPYNPGHLMVAPYSHVSSLELLDEEVTKELWLSVNKAIKVLRKALEPDGFNVGVNIGRVAGAGFEDHVHVHIVPRWNGDTNFMPVISDTKVISDSLESMYRKLRKHFNSLD